MVLHGQLSTNYGLGWFWNEKKIWWSNSKFYSWLTTAQAVAPSPSPSIKFFPEWEQQYHAEIVETAFVFPTLRHMLVVSISKPPPPPPTLQPMHHAMHRPMHGPVCPSSQTPIRPHLTCRHSDYMILLLEVYKMSENAGTCTKQIQQNCLPVFSYFPI